MIAAAERGQGDPALLLLAGWCCDRASLAPLATALATRHRTVTADLRGLGDSPPLPPNYGLAEIVDDVVEVVRRLCLSPAILVGHSLGGRMALAVAQRHPEVVRALVLLDTVVDEEPAHVSTRRRELDRPDWRHLLRARFEGLLRAPETRVSDDLVERILQTPLEVARATLDAADAVDAAGALAGGRWPVLYVGAPIPRAEPGRLRKLRPDLSYGQVVGAGHFVQLDATAQVSAMVERFCEVLVTSA